MSSSSLTGIESRKNCEAHPGCAFPPQEGTRTGPAEGVGSKGLFVLIRQRGHRPATPPSRHHGCLQGRRAGVRADFVAPSKGFEVGLERQIPALQHRALRADDK